MTRYFLIASLIFATSLLGTAERLSAAPVVVWDDEAYVDSNNIGGLSDEAETIAASLVALGHTVTTFSGTSAAAWTAALAGASLVVIPELEEFNGAATALLGGGGAGVLTSFVGGGGGLITSADYASGAPGNSTLNDIFGLGVVSVGGAGTTFITAAAAGTPFAGGPASLPPHSFTPGLTTASVAGASGTSIYSGGGASTVSVFTSGSGTIIDLSWDWFNAQPVGAEDGGWLPVLGSAVTAAAGPAGPGPVIPEPSSMILFGMTALGMGVVRRRKKQGQPVEEVAVS